MACTKFEDFDKENANHQYLADAIEDGRISLDENKCVASIVSIALEAKFFLGMKAYLESQGYEVRVSTAWFPQGEP